MERRPLTIGCTAKQQICEGISDSVPTGEFYDGIVVQGGLFCDFKPTRGTANTQTARAPDLCIAPMRGSAVINGFLTKEPFCYDADVDVLICTGGQKLAPKYNSEVRDTDAVGFVKTKTCKACGLRARYTNAAFRKLTR